MNETRRIFHALIGCALLGAGCQPPATATSTMPAVPDEVQSAITTPFGPAASPHPLRAVPERAEEVEHMPTSAEAPFDRMPILDEAPNDRMPAIPGDQTDPMPVVPAPIAPTALPPTQNVAQ